VTERARGALAAALCLVVLCAAAVLGFRATHEKSVTYDEQLYVEQAVNLAAGQSGCDFLFHPPLTMRLAALGIRAGGSAAMPWPRLPFLALLVATGALAAWWSGRLYGPTAAVAAAVLVGFSPNVLAHGSLATTDLAVAAAMLANLWTLRGFLTEPTLLRAIAWAATFALALLSKLTALLLLPASGLVALLLLATRGIRFRAALLWPLAVAPVVVAALVWAAYGFDACGFEALRKGVQLRVDANAPGAPVAVYVLGRALDHGVWYYFLVTTALKEPLPFLALLLVACVRPVRPRGGWREVAFLVVPAALVFVAASASVHQLGHRYVLPAILPLAVWVSGLAAAKRRAARALVAAALVLYVADAVRVAPHFLAYTNLVVAPTRAYHHLADSNLDWRQDDASPEVRAIRTQWDIVDPEVSHVWTDTRRPALLLGATELSGLWVPHGFWGTPFTRLVRERGYVPAAHVAYSHFLFPLDSPALVRDLHDWIAARSWVDAYNVRVRFGPSILPAPPTLPSVVPMPLRPGCRMGVRRLAVLPGERKVDDLGSFAASPLEPPPATEVEWTGVLRIDEPAGYVVRLAPHARTLVLGGATAPLERVAAGDGVPAVAAFRLAPGLYPFVATQEDGALDGRLQVTLTRMSFDEAGYATPLPLDVGQYVCLPF
jgi:hypothetical protein